MKARVESERLPRGADPNGDDNPFDALIKDPEGSVTFEIHDDVITKFTLALAGSLVRKRTYAATSGTVRSDTPLFTFMLIGIVLILVGLTYFPALALGPLAEHFAGHFGL